MSKSQHKFTKKKRLRSNKVKSPEKAAKKNFLLKTENAKYNFQIYLDKKDKIVLKSGQGKNKEKFELILDL